MNAESLLISRARFDAVIFDLDGVVTKTAGVHAASWKRLFDNYLRERATREGVEFSPFDAREDYLRYVDGKPRYDGVQRFLASRGIAAAIRPDPITQAKVGDIPARVWRQCPMMSFKASCGRSNERINFAAFHKGFRLFRFGCFCRGDRFKTSHSFWSIT